MAIAKIKLDGVDKLRKKLADIGKKANTVNRRAVNVGTTPILQAVRAEVPVEEGDLKKAQAKKVYNRGPRANGIVGADESYISQDGERISKEEREKDKEVKIPAKYDHLVIYGHITPDGSQTAANPYLQRGWEAGISAGQAAYVTALKNGIEKSAGG